MGRDFDPPAAVGGLISMNSSGSSGVASSSTVTRLRSPPLTGRYLADRRARMLDVWFHLYTGLIQWIPKYTCIHTYIHVCSTHTHTHTHKCTKSRKSKTDVPSLGELNNRHLLREDTRGVREHHERRSGLVALARVLRVVALLTGLRCIRHLGIAIRVLCAQCRIQFFM